MSSTIYSSEFPSKLSSRNPLWLLRALFYKLPEVRPCSLNCTLVINWDCCCSSYCTITSLPELLHSISRMKVWFPRLQKTSICLLWEWDQMAQEFMPILMVMGLSRIIQSPTWDNDHTPDLVSFGVVAVWSGIGRASSVLNHTLITMGFSSASMGPLDWSVLDYGYIGFRRAGWLFLLICFTVHPKTWSLVGIRGWGWGIVSDSNHATFPLQNPAISHGLWKSWGRWTDRRDV